MISLKTLDTRSSLPLMLSHKNSDIGHYGNKYVFPERYFFNNFEQTALPLSLYTYVRLKQKWIFAINLK